MKFRPVRGSLRQAMSESRDIYTMGQLHDVVDYGDCEVPFNVSWEHQGYDARIGWDTYIILVKVKHREQPIPKGYTNENPEKIIKK